MKGLVIAGRVVYALPFAVFGLLHFMSASAMAGLVPSWLPGGVFWVYLTGVAMLAASIALLANKLVMQAGMGLAALLAVYILTIHLPGVFSPEHMQMAMGSLLKDLAMLGGALTLAGLAEQPRQAT